jgi:hypothetical protein
MQKTYLHNIFGEVKGQKVDVRMGLRCVECIWHWCQTHLADWQHFTKDFNDSFHMQKTYPHNIFSEVKAQKVAVRMGVRSADCIRHWCWTHSADRQHFTKDLNDSFHMQKTYLQNILGEVKAQKVDVRMGLRCADCIRHWCQTHSADWQYFTIDFNNNFHMQKTYLHNIFSEVKAQKVAMRICLRCAECIRHWCQIHLADWQHFTKDLNKRLHVQKSYLHNICGEFKAQNVAVRMGLTCAKCIPHWCRTHLADWQHFTKDLNDSLNMQKTYLHNILVKWKHKR